MLTTIHQWMTRRVLERAGFSRPMARLLGDASMWPDWYRWDAPVHAMTPTDWHGMPADPAASARASSDVLQTYLGRIRDGTPSEQILWFGFALHLVQDLAAHEGRTNPEHALQVFLLWRNPDIQPSRIRRGIAFTHRFLGALKRVMGAEAYRRLQQGEGYQRPAPDEMAVLGPRRSMLRFAGSFLPEARRFLADQPKKRVRWDLERFLHRGLDAIRP